MYKSFKIKQRQPSIYCHRCHKKPQDQFIILLCDHAICGQCIYQQQDCNFDNGEYDGFRCPCGFVTYFNKQKNGNINVNTNMRNSRNSRRASTRPSTTGVIHSRQSYPDMTRLKTDGGLTTINLSREYNNQSGYQTIDNSSLMMQKSRYPIQTVQSPSRRESHQKIKRFSVQKQQRNSYKQNYHPNVDSSQQELPFTQQLSTQIKYLELQFERSIRIITKTFNKIIKYFSDQFERFNSHVKDLCLQRIVLNKQDSQLDFSKILKKRYQNTIAKNLDSFIQKLDEIYQISSMRVPRCSSPNPQINSAITTPKQYTRSIVNIYAKSPVNKFEQNYTCKHKKLQKKVGSKRRQFIIQF